MIEGVINGFFDGGEQGFAWAIEAEQVSVLGENSLTEISFWDFAMSSAEDRRL